MVRMGQGQRKKKQKKGFLGKAKQNVTKSHSSQAPGVGVNTKRKGEPRRGTGNNKEASLGGKKSYSGNEGTERRKTSPSL